MNCFFIKFSFIYFFIQSYIWYDVFCFVARPRKVRNHTDAPVADVTILDWEVWCKLQPNGFDCQDFGTSGKFYYDVQYGDCKSAPVGAKCKHNINTFEGLTECHDACQDDGEHTIVENLAPEVYCRLQPDFGLCNSYYPRFYFDVTYRQCRGFSYSGCGGNLNRFLTYQICSAVCSPVVEY